ncbi:MAG TPA: PIN domain-containing protein [Planctomycetia bacterium]|nr:PIN domain-containing protein [Planctomycetia bacterium]
MVIKDPVLLDAGPLGLFANPRNTERTLAGRAWLAAMVAAGRRVLVPEIADYEVRRELIRARRVRGLANLDQLARQLEYLPLSTATMRKAAELWAEARRQGQPTADDRALDCDVILAAQALTMDVPGALIATTNPEHINRFVTASRWEEIGP